MFSFISAYFKWVRERMSLPTKLVIQMILTSGGTAIVLSAGFLWHIRKEVLGEMDERAKLTLNSVMNVLKDERLTNDAKEKVLSNSIGGDIYGILIKGDSIELKLGESGFTSLPEIREGEKIFKTIKKERTSYFLYGEKSGDGRFEVFLVLSKARLGNAVKQALSTAIILSLALIILILAAGVTFNHFEIVTPLRKNVFFLGNFISEMKKIYTDLKTGSTEQAASVSELSAASQELANTAHQIAEMASQVEGASKTGVVLTSESEGEVSRVIEEISSTRERVTNLSSRIMELNELSKRIGSITGLIEEISDQTNLLSVNAAIEAIGAGESGRRFGVVANEIRNLSERTRQATEEIKKIVAEINSSITKTVMATDEGIRAFDELSKSVHSLRYIFEELKRAAESTLKIAQDIRSSTDQQVSSTSQMAKALEEVSQVATNIAENATQASSISEGLEPLLEILKKMI